MSSVTPQSSPPVAASHAISWKDGISLGISVLALTISATGFYLSNFRDETSARATIVGMNVSDRAVSMDVAILNSGNRQIAVTNAEIYLVQFNEKERLRQPLQNTNLEKGTTLPVLVEPGKMVILGLSGEIEWDAVVGYREQIPGGDDHTHETIFGLKVNGLGANGTDTSVVMDFGKIYLNERAFSGSSCDGGLAKFVNRTAQPAKLMSISK